MAFTGFDSALIRVARQYESEGYTVILNPRDDQVPPFAKGLRLDLIASRGDENVIVAVRRNRSSLSDEPAVPRLAELAAANSWRLDVVVLESESAVKRAVNGAEEPSDDQFRQMIERARQAANSGLLDMALVHAWAALEAAMRRLRGDTDLYGRTTALQLLSTLYSNGFMSREEFDRARTVWDLRTQVVHGFVVPAIDPALITDILALATKLMGAERQQETQAVS